MAGIVRAQRRKAGGPGAYSEFGEGIEQKRGSGNRNKLLRAFRVLGEGIARSEGRRGCGIIVILLLPTAKWMKNHVRNTHQESELMRVMSKVKE